MRTLQILSVSHQSLPANRRLNMNLDSDSWQQLYTFMKYDCNVLGWVRIVTCNRVELYLEAEADVRQVVAQKWVELAGEDLQFGQDIKSYFGNNISNRYLLELTTGLHSAIFGDDQILFQIKKAFEEGRRNNSLSTLLERSFQYIMKTHKLICKETDFKTRSVSLAYHALKSIERACSKEECKNKNLLILGAGDMAVQVLKYLPKFEFKSVSIANRTKEKADKLAQLNGLRSQGLEEVKHSNYDVVISCIDYGNEYIADFSTLDFYVDLSLTSVSLKEVLCPSILLKELQKQIDIQNRKSQSSIAIVKRLLSGQAREFMQWEQEWKERRREASLAVI